MNEAKKRREEGRRAHSRIARFLAGGQATVRRGADGKSVLLESPERGTISVPSDALRGMAREGLVCSAAGRIGLSREGLSMVRRADAEEMPFQTQHREIGLKSVEMDGTRQTVHANLAESPLAMLARRRTKSGKPLLSTVEVEAGERLRCDYTRGMIMPRMGANWQASVSSGRRDGTGGGIAELTDAALASRQRVNHAIDAVGPELSGVLVDICCFLKGLEEVERERGWPVRSAKVVLKTALSALSRHYQPPARSVREAIRSRILHWGTEDYRPEALAGFDQ